MRSLVNYLRTAIERAAAITTGEIVVARHKRLIRKRNCKARAQTPSEYQVYAMRVFLIYVLRKHKTGSSGSSANPNAMKGDGGVHSVGSSKCTRTNANQRICQKLSR